MESNKKRRLWQILRQGIIAILTGGGDVPGLNLQSGSIRANREGYKVIGLRRSWAGIPS